LIYPPHLLTAAKLPWETSQVQNDNFQSYQPKLHITVARSKTTPTLSTQPVGVQVQLL